MKLIEASYEILPSHGYTLPDIYKDIERAGRTCYKSENKITEDSAEPFVKMIMERKHTAVLEQGTVYLYFPYLFYNNTVLKYEHNPYSKVEFNSNIIRGENGEKKCIPLEYGYAGYYITTNYRVIIENHWESDLTFICEPTEYHQKRISVRFICSRAIANELVRHRVFSYCQESSRYCNYSKEKFGANITYIIPYWINKDLIKDDTFNGDVFQDTENKELIKLGRFKASLKQCEYDYLELIKNGCSAQEAREVLPLCTKTEIVMTGYEKDWVKFFELRTSVAAHPDMRNLVTPLKEELHL